MKETMPKIVTSVPGPKSKELLKRRLNVVSNGISYGNEVFANSAKGALIKDIDGNVFLDFAAGIGVINLGHCDDDVIEAVCNQGKKYMHTSFNVCMYEPYIEVGEKLASIMPGNSKKKVMFANSGAEAVENAVKIARKYTNKNIVLSLECAFHGRTYMAMTLTSKVLPYKDGFAPFCSDTFKIPTPYYYRSKQDVSEEEFGKECADKLSTLLKGELDANTVACLIVEPIQGEGGFIVPPKGYLKRLEKICNENNILLIIDEIQSGFCRTGKMFCHEYEGIEPDLVTMSKSIAAGLPLSAVVGKKEIMDAPIPGAIGGTFGGNPLALAAANVVLDKMVKEDFSGKANVIGDVMKSRLNEMKDKYDIIGDVRGIGAMVAIELVKDRVTKEPNKEAVGKIIDYALQKGVIVLSAGIFSNCIRFLPPLVMTKEQVMYGMDVIDEAIASL